MYNALDKGAGFLARWMAYVGAAVLIALTIATCISIVGRELSKVGIGPGSIKGIFEWTQIGIAASVFAFLGHCQYARGQASVDLLAGLFGKFLNKILNLAADVAMLAAAYIITWRMWLGMEKKRTAYYPEVTTILEFPVWLSYCFGLAGLGILVLICAFCVVRSVRVFWVQDDQAFSTGESV